MFEALATMGTRPAIGERGKGVFWTYDDPNEPVLGDHAYRHAPAGTEVYADDIVHGVTSQAVRTRNVTPKRVDDDRLRGCHTAPRCRWSAGCRETNGHEMPTAGSTNLMFGLICRLWQILSYTLLIIMSAAGSNVLSLGTWRWIIAVSPSGWRASNAPLRKSPPKIYEQVALDSSA
ncbi:hypothetical protein IB238_23930 [Rhizobium sp. ARZ01]|uniref:hypothetical protein n=1 Tax=Rhizobium sp. ARZ01 TaxID=2769313 RepID=UPI00177EC5A6|nr:hypothetical protein [Rhizobium sp. ARZ01]MBD9375660.1 hypothetical protein [Rhizobium sp. ARZ01]